MRPRGALLHKFERRIGVDWSHALRPSPAPASLRCDVHCEPLRERALIDGTEASAMLVSDRQLVGPASAQFASSSQVALLDHLGISCELSPAGDGGGPALARLRTARASELCWPRAGARPVRGALIETDGAPVPIFAAVLEDARAGELLRELGGDWQRARAVTDRDGIALASIWRERRGSVFLPFDPDEVCLRFWSESYQELLSSSVDRALHRCAMRAYYAARDLLPRRLQIGLRRIYARRQARAQFPRWPIESALHDFCELIAAILVDVAGEPVPRISPWPHGRRWALVLTHDVETAAGVQALPPVLELERELGLRSAWNFVPRRYDVEVELVRELTGAGFEVGVHGLYHDGRDLESPQLLRERLPGMREAAEQWNAIGFRAPATQRGWELIAQLGFDYDSSYPDSDPFEPQGGGCCSWLPFFNGETVELPLTLPQDHTLFAILRHRDGDAWLTKAALLREQGAMALIDTHPDYLVEDRIFDAYRTLLQRFAGDATAWHALPREVSAWWRRRASSSIRRDGEEWALVGPAAAEATVQMLESATWR